LDIETLASLAPEASILVYEGPPGQGFQAYYDVYSAMIQQNQAQAISTSWSFGGCEADDVSGGINLSLVEEPLFEAMALQGQSVFAAAGDEGSETCVSDITKGNGNSGSSADPYALAVEDPADQPFVTAVGGTSLTNKGKSPPTPTETTWDDAHYDAPFDGKNGRQDGYPGNNAGTGGISATFQMPPWQVGFDTTGNASGTPCGAPSNSGGTVDCREEPDVSSLATHIVVYGGKDGWTTTGGTSAAAPEWAALTALVDEAAPSGRMGLLSPDLYTIAKATPSDFNMDIPGDNNYLGSSGTPTNDTCTNPGQGTTVSCYTGVKDTYNMATGLGTAHGDLLAPALDAMAVGITTTSLPTAQVGTAYSTTLAAIGGTTPYTWGVTSGSLPAGLSLGAQSGVISGTPTQGGTSSFAVTVTASGTPVGGANGNLPPPRATASFSITVATSTLAQGASLTTNGLLVSPNASYEAVVQVDGNVVVYGPSGPNWSSGTSGTGGGDLVLQSDGNLVLYGPPGHADWSSGTSGSGASELALQNDGNLVLYGPTGAVWSSLFGMSGTSISARAALATNGVLRSPNGACEAVLQTDGNFVVYCSGKALWSSDTYTTHGNDLVLQGDGNLVLYGPASGKIDWNTGTFGSGATTLSLADNGVLSLSGPGGVVWTS
jgi:hypothetical protein